MLRIVIAVLLSLGLMSAQAAPRAELWERWTAHVADSQKQINHSAWDALLKRYLVVDDGLNRLAYGRVSNSDQRALFDYLQALQSIKISNYNRNEQRAFWINLYNAGTVDVLLAHYPVESIRDIDISPGLFSSGPWGRKLFEVEGETLSLDDIEHRILRPIWQDPLIHYAVNCASVGCPNLVEDAYTADNYTALATANARAYVNSSRGVVIDDGDLEVSSIYEWFKRDFGGTDASVIEHLRQYAEPGLSKRLTGLKKISDDFYDWSLNDTR